MLTIWQAYLENNVLAQEINMYDEQEVEAAMQQIQLNSYEEYDEYDPFGQVDTDGNDISTAVECDSEGANTRIGDDVKACSDIAITANQHVSPANLQASNHDDKLNNRDESDTLTFEQKYPNYGWNQEGIQRDDQIQITSPDGEDPTIYGTISIATATGPVRQGASQEQDAKVRSKKRTKFNIPPSW